MLSGVTVPVFVLERVDVKGNNIYSRFKLEIKEFTTANLETVWNLLLSNPPSLSVSYADDSSETEIDIKEKKEVDINGDGNTVLQCSKNNLDSFRTASGVVDGECSTLNPN